MNPLLHPLTSSILYIKNLYIGSSIELYFNNLGIYFLANKSLTNEEFGMSCVNCCSKKS